MKFAVVSDIHGNLPALEAVVAHMARQGVELVVNLGDSLSGPLMPLETAQLLMRKGWPTLAGNHERQLLAGSAHAALGASDAYAHGQLTAPVWDWLRSLPATLHWQPGVLLCHGTPSSDTTYLLETVEAGRTRLASAREIEHRLGGVSAPLIACGHTHIPRSLRSPKGQYLINPGSVGLPAYGDEHAMPHVVENGSPDARYAVVEQHPQGWSVALHSVAYDHEPMARMAQSRGRHDWACALRTGYMPASGAMP